MKRLLAISIGLLLVIPSYLALTDLRKSTPTVERLGYKPSFEITYFTSLEFRYLISELLFYDAIFYYGSLVDKPDEKPDYAMIVKYVDTATRLNPYNIDAYYFGQATLVWDMGLVKEMNWLLKRGIKKRTWDYYLPFFLGFNYMYFLKDNVSAAEYLTMAARLNPRASYLTTLVSRLYYQSNKTEMAITYLQAVYEGTQNQAVRKSILVRLKALQTILVLENAVKRYESLIKHPPSDINDLVAARILKGIPPDPYGGKFYYDRSDGRIKTTSKLAFSGRSK